MMKFCTECGAKNEQSFKFCPNCGAELHVVSSDLQNSNAQDVNLVVCTNCGDENPLNSLLCHTCGVKLKDAKTITFSQKQSHITAERNNSDKTSQKKSKKNAGKPTSHLEIPKKLDTKKIVGLIGVIFGIFLLLLIVSGVFSESENISIPQNSDQQFQSPGADLNSISKINELRSLVEREPNNASAILDLANLRFDSGFFEDAAKNYEQYLKLNPKSADARIDMAVCYYNLQQFDRAEFEILEALKIAPKHQTGYLNLGVVYLAKQNIEKSREWFNKAVELDPTSEIGKKAKSLLQSH